MIEMIFPALLAIIFAEALWQVLLTFWNWITYERKKDMSNKYVTLDEFMNERGEWVKQVVYKVDGDFNGDIKGDNVTVILMGDGDINGNVSSKNGDVVLIKGNINGDVKANKILCPTNPSDKSIKHNPAKDVKSPKLPVKTMLSCDIPQCRIDHHTSIGNCVSIYNSFPITHITCPHCKKYFATQLRVQTLVVDGDVAETRVGEIKRDY